VGISGAAVSVTRSDIVISGGCPGAALSVAASDVASPEEDSGGTPPGEGSGAAFAGREGNDEAISEIDIDTSDG
jgi:hypothetical protein